MTNPIESNDKAQLSLSTAAARMLATTTKSAPQMQGITSRWLLKILPWVNVAGGTYRVNRRLSYDLGDGRITFTNVGATVQVIPEELCEMPLLRGFKDKSVLSALANQFVQKEFAAGDVIVELGQAADQIVLIAHGKANKIGIGKYDDQTVLGTLVDGDYFGDHTVIESDDTWTYTVKAVTKCIVLMLPQLVFEVMLSKSSLLQAHIEQFKVSLQQPQDKHGQTAINTAAGHVGEPTLPTTFVDYATSPREYELSVAQTVLQVHTRVADLYNQPMNQIEQQLRLTVEALREQQEHEMINNREFGLLHNADLSQRIPTRRGAPTPDDLDELLSRRRNAQFFLAHPRAIAAFGRECNKLGLAPQSVAMGDTLVPSWRNVPILPCNKIPVTKAQTSSIIVLRTGENNQGVIGLQPTGLPDEYEPGLNVRFMGINEKAIISYLVSAYYSAAVLVPDALGVLEDVEVGN